MKHYVKANRLNYIDTETWEFVHNNQVTEPFTADVLPWYWTFKEESEHRRFAGVRFEGLRPRLNFNTHRKTDVIQLNQLKIEFRSSFYNVLFSYFNKKEIRWQTIAVFCHLYEQGPSWFAVDPLQGVTVRLHVHLDYGSKEEREITTETPHKYGNPFYDLAYMAHDYSVGSSNWALPYGVLYQPARLEYNGKRLDRVSKMVLFGPCAMLLTDQCEFDALVELEGIDMGFDFVEIVKIKRFLHTQNPYYVKAYILGRATG